MMFITVADGLLLKLDLNFLLSATVDTFTYITSSSSSSASGASAASDGSAANATRLLLSDTTATDGGSVIETSMSISGGVLDTSATTLSNTTAVVLAHVLMDQQPVLDLNNLLRSSRARLTLPAWIQLISTSFTKARLSGVTASRLTDVTADNSNATIHSWDQQ